MQTPTLSRRGLFHRLAELAAGWLFAGRAPDQLPSESATSFAASNLPPGLSILPGYAVTVVATGAATDVSTTQPPSVQ